MIKRFIDSAVLMLVSNLSNKILSFLALSLLARVLKPVNFGIYNVFVTSAVSVNQITDFGVTVITQRKAAMAADSPNALETLYTIIAYAFMQAIANVLAVVLIFIFRETATTYFAVDKAVYKEYYPILAFLIVSQAVLNPFSNFLIGSGHFRSYIVRNILVNIVLYVALLFLSWFGQLNILNALVSLLASTLFSLLLTLHLMRARYTFTFRGYQKVKYSLLFKEIYRTGLLYYVGNVLAGALSNILIIYLFNTYLSVTEFGYLRLSGSLVSIIGIVPAAVQPLSMYFLNKGEKEAEYLKYFQIRYIVGGTFFISIFVIIFIDVIIKIVMGSRYVEGAYFFTFIVIVNVMIVTSTLISNFLTSKGRTNYIGVSSIIGVSLYAALSWFLIPIFGIQGFFIAYFIAYFVGFLLNLAREIQDSFYILQRGNLVLLLLILSFLPSLFLLSTVSSVWVRIFCASLAASIFGILFYFFVATIEERRSMTKALKMINGLHIKR